MQRKLAADRPSNNWNTSFPQENKQDMLQSNQVVTGKRFNGQMINNDRGDVGIHHFYPTFQDKLSPCPFLSKCRHSVHPLFPILIHLEVRTKPDTKQSNWFISAVLDSINLPLQTPTRNPTHQLVSIDFSSDSQFIFLCNGDDHLHFGCLIP